MEVARVIDEHLVFDEHRFDIVIGLLCFLGEFGKEKLYGFPMSLKEIVSFFFLKASV